MRPVHNFYRARPMQRIAENGAVQTMAQRPECRAQRLEKWVGISTQQGRVGRRKNSHKIRKRQVNCFAPVSYPAFFLKEPKKFFRNRDPLPYYPEHNRSHLRIFPDQTGCTHIPVCLRPVSRLEIQDRRLASVTKRSVAFALPHFASATAPAASVVFGHRRLRVAAVEPVRWRGFSPEALSP